MDSREDLPRISVDTIHEWQRVRSNFANTALSRVDSRLAASPSILNRDAVLQHVMQVRQASVESFTSTIDALFDLQFVDMTFSSAEHNLRVNGRNLEDLDENEQGGDPTL
jgi:hypothetical protein